MDSLHALTDALLFGRYSSWIKTEARQSFQRILKESEADPGRLQHAEKWYSDNQFDNPVSKEVLNLIREEQKSRHFKNNAQQSSLASFSVNKSAVQEPTVEPLTDALYIKAKYTFDVMVSEHKNNEKNFIQEYNRYKTGMWQETGFGVHMTRLIAHYLRTTYGYEVEPVVNKKLRLN